MRVLSSLLGKVGLTVSSSVRSATKDESLRNSSMGVMIISPTGFTLKSSVRKDETCMWVTVDLEISKGTQLRVLSVYYPPGDKNKQLRATINAAIMPVISVQTEKLVVVARGPE